MRDDPGYEVISNRGASPARLALQASGEALDRYVAALAARPGDRVLDVGCGDGALCRAIAATGAETWGIDLDAGKIRYCRAVAGNPAPRYLVGDIRNAAARLSGRFTVVCCRYVLMYALPDRACADLLRAMARCVAPGGRLVAFEADINFAHRFDPPLPDWAVSAFDAVVRHYRARNLIEWRRGVTLARVMVLAGLADPKIAIADARVIADGHPCELVEHDSLDIERLVTPALTELGRAAEVARVCACYRAALRRRGGFCYTPVFAADWLRPGPASRAAAADTGP